MSISSVSIGNDQVKATVDPMKSTPQQLFDYLYGEDGCALKLKDEAFYDVCREITQSRYSELFKPGFWPNLAEYIQYALRVSEGMDYQKTVEQDIATLLQQHYTDRSSNHLYDQIVIPPQMNLGEYRQRLDNLSKDA